MNKQHKNSKRIIKYASPLHKQTYLFTIRVIIALTLLSLISPHIKAAYDTYYTIRANQLPAANAKATNALREAASNGDAEAALQALAQGAYINGAPHNIDKVSLLLYEYPFSNLVGKPYITPLAIAACRGNANIVTLLLDQKAQVDAVLSGNTPLTNMCKADHLPAQTLETIVTELLAHKANVNVRDFEWEKTPLMHAMTLYFSGNENIITQLILAGADVNMTDYYGKTASDIIRTPRMRNAFNNALKKRAHIEADAPPRYEVALAAKSALACAAENTPPPYEPTLVLSLQNSITKKNDAQSLHNHAAPNQNTQAIVPHYDNGDGNKKDTPSLDVPPAYVPIVCPLCAFDNSEQVQQCESCHAQLQAKETPKAVEADEVNEHDKEKATTVMPPLEQSLTLEEIRLLNLSISRRSRNPQNIHYLLTS